MSVISSLERSQGRSGRRFCLIGSKWFAWVLPLVMVQFYARAQFTNYAVLHAFGGDERMPVSGLVEGSDGALYGTTAARFGRFPLWRGVPAQQGWKQLQSVAPLRLLLWLR